MLVVYFVHYIARTRFSIWVRNGIVARAEEAFPRAAVLDPVQKLAKGAKVSGGTRCRTLGRTNSGGVSHPISAIGLIKSVNGLIFLERANRIVV